MAHPQPIPGVTANDSIPSTVSAITSSSSTSSLLLRVASKSIDGESYPGSGRKHPSNVKEGPTVFRAMSPPPQPTHCSEAVPTTVEIPNAFLTKPPSSLKPPSLIPANISGTALPSYSGSVTSGASAPEGKHRKKNAKKRQKEKERKAMGKVRKAETGDAKADDPKAASAEAKPKDCICHPVPRLADEKEAARTMKCRACLLNDGATMEAEDIKDPENPGNTECHPKPPTVATALDHGELSFDLKDKITILDSPNTPVFANLGAQLTNGEGVGRNEGSQGRGSKVT
ncbi:hypothetical protein M407DRAFT_4003 [Tulasnella calospora MUT 4182]|uniref:Uncharacterized protein n=1 Tax=Tulasnella calospora MUT 4182 TaxID=1051891 RepID=A0A0C3QWZ5_9AGAM|nr:hypothetical protein M407DRAFT_4003 [Tulasnella calospora MUT 4182]